MKITHYYAGYRIDDIPEMTENRIIEADSRHTKQINPGAGMTHKLCNLLIREGLLGDFVQRFFKYNPGKSFETFLRITEPESWFILGISWENKVYDYFYLDLEWRAICKQKN